MNDKTMTFSVCDDREGEMKRILLEVFEALKEKGYNPINQIVGYVMSGDPTYITSHNNARSLIMKVERDELVEEMLKEYIKTNKFSKILSKFLLYTLFPFRRPLALIKLLLRKIVLKYHLIFQEILLKLMF